MIESRKWWVMVGNHHVYEEIEQRFYPEADGSFCTVMGPPPKKFGKMFERLPMIVLNFGRKAKMSPTQLMEFMNNHPERKGFPALEFSDERDIIVLMEYQDE